MREDGEITAIDPEKDRPIGKIPTLQCAHCGGHFPVRPERGRITVPGVGILRAAHYERCSRCNGPICGAGCYGRCVPAERQIENLEAGRDVDTPPPAQVAVCKPRLILPDHVR